jgi:hypothetical protein
MRIGTRVWVTGALATGLAVLGCSSSGTPSGPTGGPVAGAQDTHCDLPDGGVAAQVTHLSTCNLPVQDAGPTVYGATNYNSEANDDDCKYHVAFTVTPVRENTNVTFTVTATTLIDGLPATGTNTLAEVFLNDTHPARNSGQKTTEQAGGVYQIGPIQFDLPGQWTVRFHLHEECQDQTADSPHGHAAFFIAVP